MSPVFALPASTDRRKAAIKVVDSPSENTEPSCVDIEFVDEDRFGTFGSNLSETWDGNRLLQFTETMRAALSSKIPMEDFTMLDELLGALVRCEVTLSEPIELVVIMSSRLDKVGFKTYDSVVQANENIASRGAA